MSESNDDGWLELSEFWEEIDLPVFLVGAIITIGFIVAYALAPQKAGTDQNYVGWAMHAVNNWLWSSLTWYYLLAMVIFVAFSLFLMIGPWGKIKIGGEDTEPTHSFYTYLAMFFSAGIAAGVDFWGPAEGIFHFGYGTPLGGANPQELMVNSMAYTFFHWGVSAWCAYLIVGIPVAYFAYNKGAPFRLSTLLSPFIGIDNLKHNNWARLVDIIAVFATIGGVATSLGLIGQQLVTGINYEVGTNFGRVFEFAFIAGVTIIFTLSVVSGVERGIKRISQVNVGLFGVIAVVTFLVGFPFFVLNLGTDALGTYIQQFVHLSFFAGTGMDQTLSGVAGKGSTVHGYVGSWTIFYWAWWFSWAPFSGIFLARVSKGRTIREIAFTGVIATTLASIPWFMVLGGTAMKLQATGQADILGPVNQFGKAVSGYPLFGALPAASNPVFGGLPFIGSILAVLFFVLVITFFVTSADSSTLSLAMLTTGGKEHPSRANRLFWGVVQGVFAGLLVYIGGTDALQQAAIITGGPVAIVGLVGIYGLIREFSSEYEQVLVQEGGSVTGAGSILPGGGDGDSEPDVSASSTEDD